MDFWIQSSAPNSLKVYDENDETLCDAIETVFPMLTENAIIVWKTIHIPLSYKYDLSCMIHDIIDMLNSLRTEDSGTMIIHWGSNTFSNIWDLNWGNNNLTINARWNSVLGHTEDILNATDPLYCSIQSFRAEWKKVLYTLLEALKKGGYDQSNTPDIEFLELEYNLINSNGILYE
ncbi:hypothetical protein SAMN05720606_112188 [Paenibacillus polysaccharolyticus]|uniref:Uncharacterized protein n=1 Tax=Paenibacillus polysaccharolyticus TaxID=582692 RepID=A0A1G5K0E2_9BACL|nr:hypothetical protein [Paenibacillus polysaccharolyticus]SCY93641.1 hypothetical protein SAMN05720606_112188 [Paenibacillus polysaccharolyticus]